MIMENRHNSKQTICWAVLMSTTLFAFLGCGGSVDPADPLEAGSTFTFRDTRTPTQTGYFIGDRIAVGVYDVTPNPDTGNGGRQTTAVARQGGVETQLPFFSGAVGTQHVNSVEFSPALTGSWEIEIRNPGSSQSVLTVNTLALGMTSLVPFVTNGRMTPNGITPRISWDFPAMFTPDSLRLFIFDLDRRTLDGSALVIHTEDLGADVTFFDIPSTMDEGDSLAFQGRYEIAVMLQKLRSNGSLLARSRTFYSFSPTPTGPTVQLPIIGPDGVLHFDRGITPAESIVIELVVASRHEYRISDGDPLFASVSVLTDLGIGDYTLTFESGGASHIESLPPGVVFDFTAFGGAEAFVIDDIEDIVGLDPLATTAFLTEVSFTALGRFTGTVVPTDQAK